MLPHESGDGSVAARPCGICTLIERCRAGAFADFVAELPHSFVILGDAQFYRGYCVVLAKRHVNEIHLMPPGEALALFDRVHKLLTDDEAGAEDLGKLAALSGVREYPARVKCASLCWHTLASALKAPPSGAIPAVSTE